MSPYALIDRPLPYGLSLKWVYLLLLASGVMIPSDGEHGMLKIKSLAFLLTSAGIGFHLLAKKTVRHSAIPLLIISLIFGAFCIFWLFIAEVRAQSSLSIQLEHVKIVTITLFFFLYTRYLILEQLISFKQIFKTIIFVNCAYSLIKIGLIFFLLFSSIDSASFLLASKIRIMSMDIHNGLFRLQTSVDILTPFLFILFLNAKRFGIIFSKKFILFYTLLSVTSIFFSFSRFLIGSLFIGLLLQLTTYSLSKLLSFCLSLLLAAGLILSFLGPETISSIVQKRTTSDLTEASDDTRKEQVLALLETYQQTPYLGQGFGGYSPHLIRDKELTYSYEVQWIATLMQFGLIGLLILIAPLFVIGVQYLLPKPSRISLVLGALFCLWLAGGFTNPFVFSLASGIIYTLFFLVGKELQKRGNL